MNQAIRLSAVQEELRHFVRQEHEAQRQFLQALWRKPVEERVELGRTVVGGAVHMRRPPAGLVLRVPFNDSFFREGDFVRLSRGRPEEPLCDAVVVSAEDETIELHLWKEQVSRLAIPAGCDDLQIDVSAFDMEKYYLGAIDDLAATEAGRERILPLFDGTREVRLDVDLFDKAAQQAEKEGFDEEQTKAMASAAATDLCWLIHGPPGTGKTRVLACLAAQLLARGERILVTSANHRTINHLLTAIGRQRGDWRDLCKIALVREAGLEVQQCDSFADSGLESSAAGYVIGATPYALRSRRLGGVDFDTVIIDEASQVTRALALMAMLAGRRYILAGDHKQLPPVCLSLAGSETEQTSIFGSLIGRGMDTMLTTTHRLNEPLCAWPSEQFYLGRLRSSPVAAKRRLVLTQSVGAGRSLILAGEPAKVWLAVPHEDSRSSSPEEVEAMAAVLLEWRAKGLAWQDVGVVVPFRRQARLLRQRLRRAVSNPVGGGFPVVDTVERMQGQEREVVMISFTASDPFFVGRLAGFLLQPQRLNVAATRPRTKLIVVACPSLVTWVKRNLPEEESAPFLSLLESCERVDWDPAGGEK
jgi:DNA replication ATP-dependent helicase Dna2